jgi:hypothetical protein
MLEDLAVWFGCNPSLQDPILCIINTILILPGVVGLSSVFLLYIMAVPIVIWAMCINLVKYIRQRIRGD